MSKAHSLAQIALNLAASAKEGLTYSKDPFDLQRYAKILGAAAELLSLGTAQRPETIENFFLSDPGPMTPKLGVRTGIFNQNGEILLVQEVQDGLWAPPGGWIDVNATPAEAAQREVFEETGYDIEITDLCGVFDHRRLQDHPLWHVVCLFFMGKIIRYGNPPEGSAEVRKVGFFPRAMLPPLSNTRVELRQIEMLFDWHVGHTRAAFFDKEL